MSFDLLDLICDELDCTPGDLLDYDRPDAQIGLFQVGEAERMGSGPYPNGGQSPLESESA